MQGNVALLPRVGAGKFIVVLSMLALLCAPGAWAAEPLAITDAATEVGSDQATLNGRVNPNGVAVETCRLQYGITTAYGAAVPCQPASPGSGNANATVYGDHWKWYTKGR